MKKIKITLPNEPRLPQSTRSTQVHKDVNDYNRNLEKEEVAKELEDSEWVRESLQSLSESRLWKDTERPSNFHPCQ